MSIDLFYLGRYKTILHELVLLQGFILINVTGTVSNVKIHEKQRIKYFINFMQQIRS